MNVTRLLVGAHYFGGWYDCTGTTKCFSHWKGYSPNGTATPDWRLYYPERIPLLGNSSVDEASVAREVHSADKALDYFDVLYYDGGVGPEDGAIECGNSDPNLAHCLDTALAWMLNSTRVWEGTKRLNFFITYSNDVDRSRKNMFVGASGRMLWESYARTWAKAMGHPKYMKINNRPVFKVLIPDSFLSVQCGNNATLARELLDLLRNVAVDMGVGNPLIGGGWQNPSIPGSYCFINLHTHQLFLLFVVCLLFVLCCCCCCWGYFWQRFQGPSPALTLTGTWSMIHATWCVRTGHRVATWHLQRGSLCPATSPSWPASTHVT
jgi:hypothetical protein